MRCGPWFTLAIGVVLSGCTIQRSLVANEAPNKMIGLSNEQVLACMGAPTNKAAVGATEVWTYQSPNNLATGRYCTVNVTMTSGAVSAVNYLGPTGGLLSPNEQCAFAVAACVEKR